MHGLQPCTLESHLRAFTSKVLLLCILYQLHCFISSIWACTLSSKVDSLLVILQDNVPAFESSEAVAIIERNLGGKLLDKYESFDMQPIAAASLGQVITSGSLLTPAAACVVLITACHEKGRNKFCLSALMKEQHKCCCCILYAVVLQSAAALEVCVLPRLTSVMCLASWPGRQHQLCMALCTMPSIFTLCCAWCHGLGCSTNAWHCALWLEASCCAVLCCAVRGVLIFDAVPLHGSVRCT